MGFKNIVGYAKEQLKTFEELPFHVVDSMILSCLSYVYFQDEALLSGAEEGCSIRDLFKAEHFSKMVKEIWSPQETLELIAALTASPRYREIRLLNYRDELDPESNKQFAAVTYRLPGEVSYVAFRGTDWSLTGWKEDFKMSLQKPIPSQKLAKAYLESVAERFNGPIYVGGHSKGGNLAVYAAANCCENTRERIIGIFSHDGPGFSEEELEKSGYVAIRSRINKTVPQFSVFGMLFEQEAEYTVVESHEVGLMQHNMMCWEVNGDEPLKKKNLNMSARLLRKRVNTWINSLDYEERAIFIDTLFELVDVTKAENIEQISGEFIQNMPVIWRAIRDMKPEMQQFMLRILLMLFTGEGTEEDPLARKS